MAAFARALSQPLRGAGLQGHSHAAKSCSPGSAPVEDHIGNLLQCQQCFPAWGFAGSSSALGHLGSPGSRMHRSTSA